MFAGVLFTTIVSFANAFFSFCTFFQRPRNAVEGVLAYAWFWFFMGLGWMFTAAQSIAWYMGWHTGAIASAYILQTDIVIAVLWSVRFASAEVLNGRHARRIWYAYICVSVLFLLTLFYFPLRLPEVQFFANHIFSSRETFAIFSLMVIPLVASSIVLFFRAWRSAPYHKRSFHLLASTSFILLGIAGSFDESGLATDWMVTASRLITLIASILSYIAMVGLRETQSTDLTV